MDIVGFTQDEKMSLYTLLSAILNLGNVAFSEVIDNGGGHDTVALTEEECKSGFRTESCENIQTSTASCF